MDPNQLVMEEERGIHAHDGEQPGPAVSPVGGGERVRVAAARLSRTKTTCARLSTRTNLPGSTLHSGAF